MLRKEITIKSKFVIKASIISLIGASLVACGASLREYEKFARAGQEYAAALDTLLVTSGNYAVDANSESLLRNRLEDVKKRQEYYRSFTKQDKDWLMLIGRMRQHTALLQRYFIALENLATSDAPIQAQEVTEDIFTQLNNVSTDIKGNSVFSDRAGSALSEIPKIILSNKIKGALRKELEQRKETIYKELELQESVLKLLTIQLTEDLKNIQNHQEYRLLLRPYTAADLISDPDAWIERRRNILTMTLSIEALNDASESAKDFKEAFKLLLEDKFTIARANELLSDINSLVNVAEGIKNN
ncbi:hypothetical protein LC613_04935 [Nostoc sphaeroides CHAB 2801]|uniref:hypothetical protein n=1 Tax=Nostoc sphaeroides TaxID=446679 RepID=UPI000E54BAD9|nr:hypothetical protein [Nostoc sphaeroides]MCC5627529.1 hypothetical protein [Nostoc sphaeroides CHAB 2801]